MAGPEEAAVARLQILELPEETGGDRPFVFVVDQIAEGEGEAFFQSQEATNGFAAKAGARAVVAFHGMTIDIPANEALPLAEDATTAQLIEAHERTRLDLCDALQLPQHTTWRNLVNHASGVRNGRDTRAATLERLRNLATRPEMMDAQHEQPQGYLQGYSVAIADAKQAARTPMTEDEY